MVTPLITERLVTTPVVTPTRRRIDEAFIIMGTADGGNVATGLPVNTPTRFRSAPARAAAATGAAITDGVAAGDWSVIFNTAQSRSITNTLDFYVRETWAHVDEDIIVVHVEHTGNAPPTTAQWNAAIDSLTQIRTRYPTIHPSFIAIPDYDFLRDATSPYAATTPTGSVGAIPFLTRLNSAAEDLEAVVVIGGSPTFTRAQAVFWAARNYHSDVAMVFPAARGSDTTPANAFSAAPAYVVSALERESDGVLGITGRGVALNMMRAEGIGGIVPTITQSYGLQTTDDFLLNQAGIMTLFNQAGEWRWRGEFIAKDYSTTAPNPLTDILSVKRYAQRLQAEMRDVAINAITSGYRGDRWFDHVLRRGNAILSADIGIGRIQSGSMFILDPPTNPATTARIGYRFAPYYPNLAAELEGHIELPTFTAA